MSDVVLQSNPQVKDTQEQIGALLAQGHCYMWTGGAEKQTTAYIAIPLHTVYVNTFKHPADTDQRSTVALQSQSDNLLWVGLY